MQAECEQEGVVQAESEQPFGVATNTPRRCEVAEEEEEMPGASSMSGLQNAQQKHRMRQLFELLNQQVLDVMSDLAHASML